MISFQERNTLYPRWVTGIKMNEDSYPSWLTDSSIQGYWNDFIHQSLGDRQDLPNILDNPPTLPKWYGAGPQKSWYDKVLDYTDADGNVSYGFFKGMPASKADAIGSVASTVGNIGGKALSTLGGSSTVGNVISGVGGAVSMIPNPYTRVAGAALSLIGGGISGLMGSTMNDAKIGQIESSNNQLAGYRSTAGSFDSLASNYRNAPQGMTFSKKDIGHEGPLSHKVSRKYHKLIDAQNAGISHIGSELENNRKNLISNQFANMMYNYTGNNGTYAEGGSLEGNYFGGGSWMPSKATQAQISKWEGSSMKTNRPFNVEAMSFRRQIPDDVWAKLPEQARQGLFSYSYNTGSGNFRKRVVPVLNSYVRGQGATIDDVTKAMYANLDTARDSKGRLKYPGLSKRRNVERSWVAQGFGNSKPTLYHIPLVDNNHVVAAPPQVQQQPVVPAISPEMAALAQQNALNAAQAGISQALQGSVQLNTPTQSQQIDTTIPIEESQQQAAPAIDRLQQVADVYNMLGMDNPLAGMFAEGGGIHIAKNKRGTFRAQASKMGMGTQEAASHILANKDKYSPAMVKKANFARNASKWHSIGGFLNNPYCFGGSIFADGGIMNSNGATFDNGLTYINKGGTHEQNPYGGVQVGVDSQGTPNYVEQGEVIWDNDYVFSNRLKVPKALRGKYKLRSGATFADAAKKISQGTEERPNDPITKNGLKADMNVLIQAQEEIRAKQQMREMMKQMQQQMAMQQAQQQMGGMPQEENPLAQQGNPYAQGMPEEQQQQPEQQDAMAQNMLEQQAMQQQMAANPDVNMQAFGGPLGEGNYFDPGGDKNTKGKPAKDYTVDGNGIYQNGKMNAYDTAQHNALFQKAIQDWSARQLEAFNALKTIQEKREFANKVMTQLNNLATAYNKAVTGYRNKSITKADILALQQQFNSFGYNANVNDYLNSHAKNLGIKTANRQKDYVKDNPLDQAFGLVTYNRYFNDKDLGDKFLKALNLAYSPWDDKTNNYYGKLKSNIKTVNQILNPAYKYALPEDKLLGKVKQYIPLRDYLKSNTDINPETIDKASDENVLSMFTKQGDVTPIDMSTDRQLFTYPTKKDSTDTSAVNMPPELPTWQRYTPVVAAGIGALTDAFNLTNKPDYSNLGSLEGMANGDYSFNRDVAYTPIPDYMRYNPVDLQTLINEAQSRNLNTVNSLVNLAPTRSAAFAAARGADNDYNNDVGKIYREAMMENEKNRQAVAAFNQQTNTTNATNAMNADKATLDIRARAAAQLSADRQALITLREKERQAAAERRANNLTSLLTSLSNIGRENFAFNQINRNPANHANYGTNPWGSNGAMVNSPYNTPMVKYYNQ